MKTYGYSKEELEIVGKPISKTLEERGIKAERFEGVESCRFNLNAEILHDLSYITRRVAETGLGAMTYADEEEFPLDFEADMNDEGLRLTLWF